MTRTTATARWGYLAALWALAFAAVSIYWAAGGTVGASTLSTDLEADIRDGRDTLALGVGPAVIKLALAALGLALTRPWGTRRGFVIAGFVVGGGLALYGAASTVEKALMASGVVATPGELQGDRVTWYLAFWDPLWLLGGLLFLAAAREARRA